jgi:hypothetical protein
MAGTSCSARLSGLKALIFGRRVAVRPIHKRPARPLSRTVSYRPAVSKRVVQTLVADESFPIAVFPLTSGLSERGFLGIYNRSQCIRNSYPLSATDVAMRGLFISTVNAAIALAEGS